MNLPAIQELRRNLFEQTDAVATLLPEGMDVNQFLGTTLNAISSHPQAGKILAADRQSLFASCKKAAADGLQLDGREATLVTFKNQVAYMPMTQGLVKLANNSGEIAKMYAEVVYSNDNFRYRPGVEDEPLFDPDWFEVSGPRGEPVGCYAVIYLTNGHKIVACLPKARILAIGRGGRNEQQYIPGQGAHFAEWWKKTAIKNVLKYAPRTTHLDSALAHDNEHIDPDQIPADYVPAAAPAQDVNSQLAGLSMIQPEPITVDQEQSA